MKPTKPAFNAYRKKVAQKEGKDGISQNTCHGETLIPIGEEQAVVVLPKAKDTHTYEILKTEDMKGNLNFGCGETGFLRGLLLTNNEGLSITPISEGIRSINLNPNLADGSWVEMLSEGNDWFCWGWAGNINLVESESEVFRGSKKLDLDDDLLTVAQEAEIGTDPTNPDTDGGGVIDGVEHVLGLNPLNPADDDLAKLDTDGDTFTDEEEVLAGTNWQDINHYPGSTEDTVQTPEAIGPTFDGIPNTLNIQPLTDEVTVSTQIQDLIDSNEITAWDAGDGEYKTVTFTINNYPNPAEHNTSFTVTFSATDSLGNTTPIEKSYTIADTNAPTITLLGAAEMTVTIGSIPPDPGATATDAYDQSPTIVSSWAVDVGAALEAGTANVEYYAIDSVGNRSASVYRAVTILEEGEVVDNPPTITIIGADPLIIEAGTLKAAAVIEALVGVTADDGEGADITANIAVTFDPPYDSAHNSISTITYTVTDGVNDPVTETRSLQVIDETLPTITISVASPYQIVEGQAPASAPTATATDDVLGDISGDVTNDWNQSVLNGLAIGETQTITYTIDNGVNALTTATLEVEIIAAPVLPGEWIEEVATIGTNSSDSLNNGILQTVADGTDPGFGNIYVGSYFDLSRYTPSPANTATYSIWFRKDGDTYFDGSIEADQFPILGNRFHTEALALRVQNNQIRLGGVWSAPSNFGPYIGNIAGNIEDGGWHHLVLSFGNNGSNQTELQAVVDGVAGTLQTAGSLLDFAAVTEPLRTYIGSINAASSQYASGSFDAFEIAADVVLTIPQMQALYNAGQGNMTIQAASEIVGTFPTFSGIQEALEIEEGTSLGDVETALLAGVTASDVEDGPISLDASNLTVNTYSETLVDGNTFDVTYSVTDSDGNTRTVSKTYGVVALSAIIPENLTIDADLFANTVEKSYEGIATMMDLNNKILSFNGSSALTFYNGYKYDPQPVTTSEVPDAPGSQTTRTIGDTTGARTYSIWVRRDIKGIGTGNHSGTQVLFWKGGDQSTLIAEEKGWWIGINNASLSVKNESNGLTLTASVTNWDGGTTTGPFKHVVVVWTADGVNSRVYIDGNLAITGDLGVVETSGDETNIDSYHGDSTVSGNQQVLRIGKDTAGLFGYIGALAWPSIYHGELNQAQITDLYNSQDPILTAAVTEIYDRSSDVVEDDFFNSQEQEIIGTLTENQNDSQIQTFDGSSYIRFFEGYKYDIVASPSLKVPFNSFNKAIYTGISELARAKTYSTWFNADNASATTQYLMAKGDNSTKGWALFIENGTIKFRTQYTAQPTISHTPAQPLDSGVWYHVSVVVNTDAAGTGGDSKMYLNGQLVETGPSLGAVQTGYSSNNNVDTYYNGRNTESINFNFVKLRIGAAYPAAGLFSGKIAYSAIHIGELSAVEIQALYDNQIIAISEAELTTNAQAVYDSASLEETGTEYLYSQASNTSSITTTRIVDGVVNTGSGIGYYIDAGTSYNFVDQVTVSLWFKGNPTSGTRIISNNIAPSWGGWFIAISGGGLQIRSFDSRTFNGSWDNVGSGLDDNNWHHIVFSYEQSATNGLNVWIDGAPAFTRNTGVSDATTSWTNPANGASEDAPMMIAANPSTGWNFNGNELVYDFLNNVQIDSVKVLNSSSLVDEDVASLYNYELQSHQ